MNGDFLALLGIGVYWGFGELYGWGDKSVAGGANAALWVSFDRLRGCFPGSSEGKLSLIPPVPLDHFAVYRRMMASEAGRCGCLLHTSGFTPIVRDRCRPRRYFTGLIFRVVRRISQPCTPPWSPTMSPSPLGACCSRTGHLPVHSGIYFSQTGETKHKKTKQ